MKLLFLYEKLYIVFRSTINHILFQISFTTSVLSDVSNKINGEVDLNLAKINHIFCMKNHNDSEVGLAWVPPPLDHRRQMVLSPPFVPQNACQVCHNTLAFVLILNI